MHNYDCKKDWSLLEEVELERVWGEERSTFRNGCLSLFPVKYSDRFYDRIFNEDSYYTFFIKLGYLYAGVCSVHIKADGAYLLVFGIYPDFRGKMIGSKSLRLLENFVSQTVGTGYISLHVHSANIRAAHFYLSNGYVSQGVVEDYYTEITPQSALALYKIL